MLGHIKNFTKANKNLKECVILDEVDLRDGDPIVQIYSSIIKPPSALITGRVFVDAKYIWTGDMMCLMSSEGNEKERSQFLDRNSKAVRGMTNAFCKISGFKFTPVLDKD